MTPTAACKCGAEEQTADHIIICFPVFHHPSRGLRLESVDEKTVVWLNNTCPSIFSRERFLKKLTLPLKIVVHKFVSNLNYRCRSKFIGKKINRFYNFYFHLVIYSLGLQECVGGVILRSTVKQFPQPISGDAQIFTGYAEGMFITEKIETLTKYLICFKKPSDLLYFEQQSNNCTNLFLESNEIFYIVLHCFTQCTDGIWV